MATPLPGSIPTTITTVEQLLVYSVDMYRRVAAGKRYAERSDADQRPFLQASIDDVYGKENDSQRFVIFRGAVPLDPDYALKGKTLWDEAPGLTGSVTLPTGYTD